MNLLAQIKRSTIVHALFAISYFTSGLIINLAQCFIFLIIRPFNKTLFRKLMYYLCYSFYCQLVFMADWWSNSKLYVYVEPEVLKKYMGKEHVLLLMNHSYEIDWLMGWVFCEKVCVLGNCKAYAKKVIQYIPTVGWAWKFAEFVFLERSFEKDRQTIAKQLKELFDYPSSMWLLLNAEGTRFTPAKHEASISFAKERGLTELKYHLIPRSKGFTTSLPHLREKCKAVYDIQLAFHKDDKIAPTLSNLLVGKGVTGHLFMRRFPIETIPEDEKAASQWLQDLWIQKDKLQDSFHTTGDFFKSSGMERIEPILMKPRLSSLINTLGWAVVILTPMIYYLFNLLLNGNFIGFSIGITIFIAFYMLMQKSIGMSKISKGSSYGSTTPTTPVK